jgi:hypothetical protein
MRIAFEGHAKRAEVEFSSSSALIHRYMAGARAESKVSRNARGSFEKAVP